jgi:hypothetical protein
MDFVHRLYFNKITFRKLDLLQSSGKNGRTKTLAVGPLVELASDLDKVITLIWRQQGPLKR